MHGDIMTKKLLVNFVSKVNASGIKRETRGGIEYIILPSKTLPADTVMNNGLYPKEERDKSYLGLNGTHAPLGHPKNTNEQHISATDPDAVTNGYIIGAKNENVRLNEQLDVIEVDKAIPVAEAMKSDKGRDLLNRINMLEKGKGEPIHTSTGVFLEVEQLEEPKTNEQGDRYTWIASNMNWDHDAILLDEIGANQPHQNVGIFANHDGQEIESIFVNVDIAEDEGVGTIDKDDALLSKIKAYVNKLFANNKKDNYNEIDIQTNEGVDPMRETMIAALSAKGISVNADISNADLLAKYNESLAANAGDSEDDSKLDAVVNSVAALNARFDKLEQKANAEQEAEKAELVSKVVAHKAFGLNEDAAKSMQVEALQAMVNSIKPDYQTKGVDPVANSDDDGWKLGAEE
jgi:hypothetical protein